MNTQDTLNKLLARKNSTEELLKKLLTDAAKIEQQHKQVTEEIYSLKGRLMLINELINEEKTITKSDDK